MKKRFLTAAAVLFGLGAMLSGDAGFAQEPIKKERNRSHIELDPGNTGTYTGDAAEGNYLGNCAPCHGMTGKGDGPLAEALGEGLKARNLNDAGLLSARSDEFLFKAIKSGGVAVGLSEAMPSWQETFTDAEIKQIVRYIRNSICQCRHEAE